MNKRFIYSRMNLGAKVKKYYFNRALACKGKKYFNSLFE